MQIGFAPDEAVRGPLREAHQRVLSMAMIHEQLYQSETLSEVDFGRYVELLAMNLFQAYAVDPGQILMEVSAEPIRLTIHQAIPCGLVLNELLSNALKHAFRDGRRGTVRIVFRRLPENRAELAVEDDGVGLPPDFKVSELRSLGLQVVQALAEDLGADLRIESAGGTRIAFEWKLSRADDGDPYEASMEGAGVA
jgi:two-component sensor histidine kinase